MAIIPSLFPFSSRIFLWRVLSAVLLPALLAPAGWGAGGCDLNVDGQVNVVDVQMGVNQSLGVNSCSGADVNLDGQCNVIDVQLVINAALGDGCPTQLGESPVSPSPWVTGFSPTRTHYVDDVSCGGNGSLGSPECLAHAGIASHYTAGDLHIFRAGTYNIETIFGAGKRWELSENCSKSKPCVWKAFVSSTGQPERADINGSTRFTGDWHWFVGLNLGGTTTTNSGHMEMRAGGIHAINNVFEGCTDSCMEPWSEGPNQVIYGNVVASTAAGGSGGVYAWYTQNDFASYGWKYWIQNIAIGTNAEVTPYLVHAYTEGGYISGMHFEKNFFGGATATNIFRPNSTLGRNLIWKQNYMLDVASSSGRGLRLGSHATVMEVTDSYFGRSNFNPEAFWGNSGSRDRFIFTRNEIYDPPEGNHIQSFVTAGASGSMGSHKLPNQDLWDDNTYGGTFRAQLHCNGTNSGNRTLAQWISSTSTCRVTPGSATGFDASSRQVANPTTPKVVVLQNEYQCPSCVFQDQDRGNIYIANWGRQTSNITVDISGVVAPNKQYTVRYAKDFYGAAAASGTCPGAGACNVSLPTKQTGGGSAGVFALAYVITGQP